MIGRYEKISSPTTNGPTKIQNHSAFPEIPL